MPPDLEPELGHVCDAAGWALGVLNPADALAFQQHLPGCVECQQAVTDFQRVARVLKRPSPVIELPPDLEERTITAVLQAAAAARQAPGKASQPRGQEARKIIRWPLGGGRARLLTAGVAAAAAVVVAAVVVPLSLGGAGPSGPVAASFSLQSVTGTLTAGGQATVYQEPTGFKIVLHLHGLPATHNGQYYGCWYIGPQNSVRQPSLITAGSFTVGRSGTADPTMWSAANPAKFPTMEITIDTDTGTAPGKQILVGHAAL
jgi:Anti-sigma-K factor rskA